MREINSDNGVLRPRDSSPRALMILLAASAISARRGFWVEVRGKSCSGQTIHWRIRWYSSRVRLAFVHYASWFYFIPQGFFPQKKDCTRLSVSPNRQRDNNAVFHFRLMSER